MYVDFPNMLLNAMIDIQQRPLSYPSNWSGHCKICQWLAGKKGSVTNRHDRIRQNKRFQQSATLEGIFWKVNNTWGRKVDTCQSSAAIKCHPAQDVDSVRNVYRQQLSTFCKRTLLHFFHRGINQDASDMCGHFIVALMSIKKGIWRCVWHCGTNGCEEQDKRKISRQKFACCCVMRLMRLMLYEHFTKQTKVSSSYPCSILHTKRECKWRVPVTWKLINTEKLIFFLL